MLNPNKRIIVHVNIITKYIIVGRLRGCYVKLVAHLCGYKYVVVIYVMCAFFQGPSGKILQNPSITNTNRDSSDGSSCQLSSTRHGSSKDSTTVVLAQTSGSMTSAENTSARPSCSATVSTASGNKCAGKENIAVGTKNGLKRDHGEWCSDLANRKLPVSASASALMTNQTLNPECMPRCSSSSVSDGESSFKMPLNKVAIASNSTVYQSATILQPPNMPNTCTGVTNHCIATRPDTAKFKTPPNPPNSNSGSGSKSFIANTTMQRSFSSSIMKRTPPMCECGRRATCRMAQSPGPNMGRFFYCCSHGRNSKKKCSYFKWDSGQDCSAAASPVYTMIKEPLRLASVSNSLLQPLQQPNFDTPHCEENGSGGKKTLGVRKGSSMNLGMMDPNTCYYRPDHIRSTSGMGQSFLK